MVSGHYGRNKRLMANRRFTSGGDVPELTGNQERDLRELHDYLVLLANELGYRLGQIEDAISSAGGASE